MKATLCSASLSRFNRCGGRPRGLRESSIQPQEGFSMKRSTASLAFSFLCAAALTGSHAFAQDKTTTAGDALAKFVGDGVCTGTMMAGKNSGSATSGKFHAEKTLDGHWIALHYRQDRSAANPRPFEVVQNFGYDPVNKRYITVMLGNGDGVYSVGKSPGWRGDSITFEEVEMARGQAGHTREAFTTNGSGLSGYAAWFRDKDGHWIKADEEHCKPS
ncbi:MAG TPA: DUF1579 family protein [Rhodanobacteraceae bacterium]|nr:DUF1579 family protein [Rhodanobacteraceae bacterium]